MWFSISHPHIPADRRQDYIDYALLGSVQFVSVLEIELRFFTLELEHTPWRALLERTVFYRLQLNAVWSEVQYTPVV